MVSWCGTNKICYIGEIIFNWLIFETKNQEYAIISLVEGYEVCSMILFDTSVLINFFLIFLKQTLIEHKIPFEIVQDNSFYSEKNMKALEHSKMQMENGQHSIHELIEV